MTWTDATSDLDGGTAYGGCWADDLEEFLAVGNNDALTKAILKSADGINWIYKASPFDGGVGRAVVRRPETVVSGPLMKADASVADAYAQIDLGADQSEVWVTYTLAFDAAALAVWTPNNSGCFALLVEPGAGCAYVAGGEWFNFSPGATPNSEHLVETHFEEGVGYQTYVDGTLVDDEPDGGGTPVRNIQFGQVVASFYSAGAVAYLKDVKVGTVRGDNDLFDGNISSGNLDAFTSTSGDVTVVDDLTSSALYVAVGTSADSNDAIVTSPDGEAPWTGRGNPFYAAGVGIAIAVRPSDDALLVAGGEIPSPSNQLAISDDDTATWTRTSPFGGGITGVGVAVRASDGLIAVLGTGDTLDQVAVSADGGATWDLSAVAAETNFNSVAIRASDGAIVLAGVDFSLTDARVIVAVSTDDGATWTASYPVGVTYSVGSSVAIRASDGALVVGFVNRTLVVDTSTAQVAVSTDDGATWTTSLPFGLDAGGNVHAVAMRDSDDAILVGGSTDGGTQIAISTDGGTTWTHSDPLLSSVAGIVVRAADDLILVVGIGGIYQSSVSSDGAATWTPGSPFSAGAFGSGCAVRDSDGALCVVQADSDVREQIAVSTDDGATWGATDALVFVGTSGFGTCVACKPSNGRLIMGANTSGGSADGPFSHSWDGIIWSGGDYPFVSVAGIDYSPGEDIWMAGGGGDAATSADDGVSWVALAHPMFAIYGVYRDETNGRWWLVGVTYSETAVAAYSEDSGATWTVVSSPLDTVDGSGQATTIINCGGALLALGGIDSTDTFQMCTSVDAGSTWTVDGDTPSPFGAGSILGLAYSPTIPLAVAFGYSG